MPSSSNHQLAKIDPACLRRINLLTAKERPFCSFCNSLVGFTWYERIQKQAKDQQGAEKPDQAMEAADGEKAGGKEADEEMYGEEQPAQSQAGADENVVEEEEKL